MSNTENREQQEAEAVRRAYQSAPHDAAMDEPPAALDDAIRAAARRAVQAGPQRTRQGFMSRYRIPLAAAATVLLSSSLLLVVIQDHPSALRSPQAEPVAPVAASAPQTPTAVDTMVAKDKLAEPPKEASKVVMAEIKASPPEALMMPPPPPKLAMPPAADIKAAVRQIEEKRRAEERQRQDSYTVVAKTVIPPPETMVAEMPRNAVRAQAAPQPALSAPAAAAAPQPAAPVLSESKAEVAKADAPSQRKDAVEKIVVTGSNITANAGAIRAEPEAKVEAAKPAPVMTQKTITASPAYTAPNAVAPAASPPPVRGSLAAAANAPPAAATVAPMTVQGGVVTGKTMAAPPPYAAPPDAPGPWIKRMEALREAGKFKELRAELERFAKQHPNVVLPKSLTELPPE